MKGTDLVRWELRWCFIFSKQITKICRFLPPDADVLCLDNAMLLVDEHITYFLGVLLLADEKRLFPRAIVATYHCVKRSLSCSCQLGVLCAADSTSLIGIVSQWQDCDLFRVRW